jgi:putative FmdB family regulatory protein
MPVYEYKCQKCQYEFSQFFTGFNTTGKLCPSCGETEALEKKISSPCSIRKREGASSSCEACSTKNCSSCGA